MFSPRVNQSVPKLNVPKKLRVPNSAPVPNGPPRSAKGIFRQWGDPPPPPIAKPRTTEQRTQSLPPAKRRPGSADPRFRRRIDKTDSNLTIDPSNTSLIGDHKKKTITHCKSESVTPRKINGEGELSNICKRTEDTKDILEKTKQALESDAANNKTSVTDKTEPCLPTVQQPKQVEQQPIITEPPENVAPKLSDYETPSMSFIFDRAIEPVCKVDKPKCADENLESKFHDHMFYSTLQTRYEPCLEKEKLSGPDIEDDLYEKYLSERVKICTSQTLMAMPLYSIEAELTKNSDEENDVKCNSTKVKLQLNSKNRDLTLICGSAAIFGASVWYYFGAHIDVDELSKTIPWLQPEPAPSMFDYVTSAAEFLLQSCASVVSFVFNILTVSLEEEME